MSNALLRSFWRRRALHDFLRRVGIRESFLSTWEEQESKRDLIRRMFPHLESSEKGRAVLREMARELADQITFPDLDGWEDSAEKKAAAADAVRALKAYLLRQRETVRDERAEIATRRRAEALREEQRQRQGDLDTLRARLDALATRLGEAQAGYDFQDWFFDLVAYYELPNRRPYTTGGRQIDGSITVGGTTYLVELKFTTAQAGAPDVDVFFKKVHDKADNTMGLLVSIAGFSSVAVAGASGPRTPLLLLDHGHLYGLLGGLMTLEELIARVRRHASQTGQAYLAAGDL
ncbi:MAG: restriction endonuclease [Gemmatimonadetes bacterium]|nr:restriction endonuclease [Gemmatimonadota bacterium]